MEKRSKTNKEIFEQKYPVEELAQNLPSEENWARPQMASLILFLSYLI